MSEGAHGSSAERSGSIVVGRIKQQSLVEKVIHEKKHYILKPKVKQKESE